MKKKEEAGEVVIDIKNLSKAFGPKEVLKDVNIKLHKGENLVILGKSGTGKSVLIKCVSGLLSSDKGNLCVLGDEVSKMNERELNKVRKKIGFLFQGGALYDSMTVRENLEFPLRRSQRELKENEIEEKVMEALKNVGLEDAIDKMPSELSGGMKKRIALARTIILSPEIMLYDEPTTGLDTITSLEISELILKMKKQFGISSIIITHDMNCAKLTADRVNILHEGECIADGTYEELKASKDKRVSAFFIE